MESKSGLPNEDSKRNPLASHRQSPGVGRNIEAKTVYRLCSRYLGGVGPDLPWDKSGETSLNGTFLGSRSSTYMT